MSRQELFGQFRSLRNKASESLKSHDYQQWLEDVQEECQSEIDELELSDSDDDDLDDELEDDVS